MWLKVGERNTWVKSHGPFAPTDVLPAESEILLIIPGNPGAAEFYDEFAEQIAASVSNLNVWIVSHANHVTSQSEHEVLLLEEQVRHKFEFVREYVPEDAKLFLLGHSIGAHMILRNLNPLKEAGFDVHYSFLLFPTVEKMAESPNGIRALRKRWFPFPILFLFCALLNFVLPISFKKWLFIKFQGRETASCVVEGALNMFDPRVLENVIRLGYNEIDTVVDVDVSVLEAWESKLMFYYAENDGWVPKEVPGLMRNRMRGKGRVVMCEQGCEHAFVITSSLKMARYIAELILANA